MSFVNVFSEIIRGEIIFTGNTLGLSKKENKNESGDLGSIGAFISLDKNEKVATFPSGTTLDYLKNGSSAFLNIPEDVRILHAELIWSGMYKNSKNNIENEIDNSVQFVTPRGKYNIRPEHRTKLNKIININGLILGAYTRSANVTQLVKNSLGGEYSLTSVPSLIDPVDNNSNRTNFCGWTLAVAYHSYSSTVKKLSINVGCEGVYQNSDVIDLSIDDFEYPNINKNLSKLFFSVGEGDNYISGDSVYFGNDIQDIDKIYGPNNNINNFFSSQINNNSGTIDTNGTFGTANHNAVSGKNIIAGRQGWDITSIDVSNYLKSNQTSALIRFTSNGDLYFPNAVGYQIETKNPNLEIRKTANRKSTKINEEIKYTIEIVNNGELKATNINLNDFLPEGLSIMKGTLFVNGVNRSIKFPFALDDLNINQKHIVEYSTKVFENYKANPIINTATLEYNFLTHNKKIITDCIISNSESVLITENMIDIKKYVDKNWAVVNDELNYTIVISNIGSTNLKDLTFIDNIPSKTKFIVGSVMINDKPFKSYDPVKGFLIPDLSIGEKVNILFKVKII